MNIDIKYSAEKSDMQMSFFPVRSQYTLGENNINFGYFDTTRFMIVVAKKKYRSGRYSEAAKHS